MEDKSLHPRKTVPPLRIKKVCSQPDHISDEVRPQSVDTSSSDNDNLIIDEMDESMQTDYDQDIEIISPKANLAYQKDGKKDRKQNNSIHEDRILVIDGDTIGSDEYDNEPHSSFEVSTNWQPVNRDENVDCKSNMFSQSSKGNRRKSHHVPKQVGDVVFEERTILTVDADVDNDDEHKDDKSKRDDKNEPNRNLMKNIAMMRTCINYVLVKQGLRPMSFKQNIDSTPKMIEYYKQLKLNKK